MALLSVQFVKLMTIRALISSDQHIDRVMRLVLWRLWEDMSGVTS